MWLFCHPATTLPNDSHLDAESLKGSNSYWYGWCTWRRLVSRTPRDRSSCLQLWRQIVYHYQWTKPYWCYLNVLHIVMRCLSCLYRIGRSFCLSNQPGRCSAYSIEDGTLRIVAFCGCWSSELLCLSQCPRGESICRRSSWGTSCHHG